MENDNPTERERERSLQEMENGNPTNLGSTAREQRLVGSSTSSHAASGFLILVLISLVQVKYQSKNASPFETHPATILAFIIAVVIHVVALVMIGLESTITSYLLAFQHAILISGVLASSLLLLILFPLFGWIMLCLCGFLVVIVACVWYRRIVQLPPWTLFEVLNKLYDWFLQAFNSLFEVFRKLYDWFRQFF